MPEIETLAKADAQRWNREGRLAAWVMQWQPVFMAQAVAMGIAAAFDKDFRLPPTPEWDELLKSLPDYMRDADG